MNTQTFEPRRKLIPVGAFPSYFPEMGLTESRIRWLIFNRQRYGFERCIRRVGRRLFLDPDKFLDWVDGQSGALNSAEAMRSSD